MIDFDEFYNRNFYRYKRYAISIVKRLDIAEDITQEAFIKLNEHPHLIKDSKCENWLRVVIKNKSIDFFRKSINTKEVSIHDYNNQSYKLNDISDDSNDILKRMDSIDEEYQIQLDYNRAIEIVEKLSPMYKMVFKMFELENMSHDSIANELGISVGTSKSNLYKARRNIREKMNQ